MATGERIHMIMDIPHMPTDLQLLTLTQWLSPSFPVGSFAYSHGLENAISEGWVNDADSLFGWLQDILQHGSGQADAAWIALAFQTSSLKEVENLNDYAKAFSASFERLREGERQGAAFARVASEVWSLDLPDLLLPIALGYSAQQQKLDLDAVTALYLQAFLSNLAAAAQRLMPLGQTEAQTIVARLNPVCLDVAEIAKTMEMRDISSSCFLSDIAAMKHETLQPRLFQS